MMRDVLRTARLGLTLTAAALAFAAPAAGQNAPRRQTLSPTPPAADGRISRNRGSLRQPAQRRERPPAVAPAEPATAAQPEPVRDVDVRPVEPPPPDRPLAADEAQIAPKLKHLLGSRAADARFERAAEHRAVQAFYAARNYAPLWIRDGRLTPQARAAILHLRGAAADGLDAADYPLPDFAGSATADALAAGDLRLTQAVLTYVRHLATGRIAPTRVSAEVSYGDHTPDPEDVLKRLAAASGIDGAIDSYNPPHPGFRALKAKLAELRGSHVDADQNRIADGPVIRPGKKDPRLPLLRERLGVHGRPGDLLYDRQTFNAVRALQFRKGLKPTGLVDARTIAAINGPKQGDVAARVRANMERWRWLPRNLGATYVMVNIPDYTLKVVHDGHPLWATRIVAGKPQTPTPLVSAPMQHIIVNPSWYVPQSIIQNELLPLYASDPNIFDRMGLEVKKGADGTINVVQPPGAANALGRIKFAFPNKFQVYLHDTPEKKLFAYDRRAFSHGCMRVENPTKFGEVLLSLAMAGPTPSEHQLARMFGQDEKSFNLQKPPMVHLTYQTVFVDDGGRLHVDDDLYGFDARIQAILHSDERRIADVPPPQDPKRDQATLKANQDILRRVERREAQNPFVFFDKLFR